MMPITPFSHPTAVANPYAGYVGFAPSYMPTAAPVGQHMLPILNSSATSTAVPGFPFGTAPTALPATSYYYPPPPHPMSYIAPVTGMPMAPSPFPQQFSYPYLAGGGYGPATPFTASPGWPYGVPVATTSGPFAGATVQTNTSVPADASSSFKGDASSKDSTSPIEPKSAVLGSGSECGSNGNGLHHQHHHHHHHQGSDSESNMAFNVVCSNRAISENRQLIVKFLTDDTSEQQFRELFERFGPVENARIIYDKKTNHTKGFGFITYKHAEHAVQALRSMGGYQLHGRQLNVALTQTERKRAFSPTELAPVHPQTVTVSTST